MFLKLIPKFAALATALVSLHSFAAGSADGGPGGGGRVGCADPTVGYNVSSTSSNNVPVGQCYLNTVGECLYNTQNPATANGQAWNAGCPANVAGPDCCRWKAERDPCKERGLQLVNGAVMNLQPGQGKLCCNSARPKEEMLSGKKVCCEIVK